MVPCCKSKFLLWYVMKSVSLILKEPWPASTGTRLKQRPPQYWTNTTCRTSSTTSAWGGPGDTAPSATPRVLQVQVLQVNVRGQRVMRELQAEPMVQPPSDWALVTPGQMPTVKATSEASVLDTLRPSRTWQQTTRQQQGWETISTFRIFKLQLEPQAQYPRLIGKDSKIFSFQPGSTSFISLWITEKISFDWWIRICGGVLHGTNAQNAPQQTICSWDTPFRVGVHFDSDEIVGLKQTAGADDGFDHLENAVLATGLTGTGYSGFQLDYWQNTCWSFGLVLKGFSVLWEGLKEYPASILLNIFLKTIF